jgi:sterol desaturase/sphingolipid hydroxylase (fatty acid hydroxylase superfamily)
MPELPNPVFWAIPFFIVTLIGEYIWQRSRQPSAFTGKDTATSLVLGIGSLLTGIATGAVVLTVSVWAYQHRLFDIGYIWWAWALCLVLDDLAYYVFHRTAHRVRWFWASHVVHHSSTHYNLSTALRQTWTGFFSLNFLFRIPLLFIGFPVEMVVFIGGINLIYQYWIHTEAIDKMPRWFEYFFNTPSHHRVHHGRNPRYLDSNYAGVFMAWDRMFGSFVAERADDPVDYGLVKPLDSFNPFWAALHEWVGIAGDMWAAPWRYKLPYLLREPGWSHDGSRETSAQIRAQWMAENGAPPEPSHEKAAT